MDTALSFITIARCAQDGPDFPVLLPSRMLGAAQAHADGHGDKLAVLLHQPSLPTFTPSRGACPVATFLVRQYGAPAPRSQS